MEVIKVNKFSQIPQNYTGKIIFLSGDIAYRMNGMLHLEGGPAIIRSNGEQHWFLYGFGLRVDEHKHFMTIKKMGYPAEVIMWLIEKYLDNL